MILREKVTLLLWFFFSLYVSVESWRMGIGSFRVPGPGFLTFGVSLFIEVLVISLVLKERARKVVDDAKPLFKGKNVKNIILGFGLLFLYPLLLDQLGYILCTMLFIACCLKVIGRKGWSVAVGVSIGTAIFAYYLFDVWLAVQFPKGKWVSQLLSWGGF